MAGGDVMTRSIAELVDDYLALRRGLGYRSATRERALRAFARYLNGREGPIPLESTLSWATRTSSTDPRNPSRRLATVRSFLRYLHAQDGTTDVPAPGLLGPTGQRKPPHVYSDAEIADLLTAAGRLAPAGGLRPRCYVTLFGLLACTGLRISEALALSCADVDLDARVITVRAGKRGLTRLVPLHASAVAALDAYASERERRHGCPDPEDAFFRTDWSERLSYNTAHHAFSLLRRQLGWTAAGRTRAPRVHDLRHRMVVRRIQTWHAREWTWTPRSRPWPPTSGTSTCGTSTGISLPSPS
jgi:site-specific recombinase XerD